MQQERVTVDQVQRRIREQEERIKKLEERLAEAERRRQLERKS